MGIDSWSSLNDDQRSRKHICVIFNNVLERYRQLQAINRYVARWTSNGLERPVCRKKKTQSTRKRAARTRTLTKTGKRQIIEESTHL